MGKKYVTIAILIVIFLLENIVIIYLANWYQENKRFELYLKNRVGLTKACEALDISQSSLLSILEKLKNYRPSIQKNSDNSIILDYGVEWSEAVGVALLFDKDYKLTHKACNAKWEPDVPSFQIAP